MPRSDQGAVEGGRDATEGVFLGVWGSKGDVALKHHLFVHQSNWEQQKKLRIAYKHVVPTLKATGSSLFFCDAIGFDILSPSWEAAIKVKIAFGWLTLREKEPGRFTTDDDIW